MMYSQRVVPLFVTNFCSHDATGRVYFGIMGINNYSHDPIIFPLSHVWLVRSREWQVHDETISQTTLREPFFVTTPQQGPFSLGIGLMLHCESANCWIFVCLIILDDENVRVGRLPEDPFQR